MYNDAKRYKNNNNIPTFGCFVFFIFDVNAMLVIRTQTNSRHAPKYLLHAELGILPA